MRDSRIFHRVFVLFVSSCFVFVARCDAQTAVAVEASTPTWHFADAIRDGVGEVRIVDSVKTRLKAGYAAKTDRLDARRLADALRRDSVVGIYYPPMAIRELRELCRGRHTLVQMRTRLLQRLRAVLLRQGIVEARRLVRRDAVLDTLALATARSGERDESAAHARRRARRNHHGRARGACGRRQRIRLPGACSRSRGLGRCSACMMRAEIGEIRRFPSGRHLASYAGLGAACGRHRRPLSLRAHHTTGIPLAPVGARRSGDARSAPPRSGGPLGSTLGDSQRRVESARRLRAQFVR